MKRRERDILKIVQGTGLACRSMKHTGSNHYCVDVSAADGRTSRFFFSKTPSDHRGDLNKQAMLRRFAQGIA